MIATRKRAEVNEPGNRQDMRDPTDHIRESLQVYDSIEANDDVIKLLKGLKLLTFKTY
jgi:hypothetical protein